MSESSAGVARTTVAFTLAPRQFLMVKSDSLWKCRPDSRPNVRRFVHRKHEATEQATAETPETISRPSLTRDCNLIQHFVERELFRHAYSITAEVAMAKVREQLKRIVRLPWEQIDIDEATGHVIAKSGGTPSASVRPSADRLPEYA